MPNYLLSYHGGGMASSAEEQAKVMAAWGQWFQGLGDKLVDGGRPVTHSVTIDQSGSAGDGGANPVTGYSVIKAGSMDDALELARGCPVLQGGASIEVGETVDMG
ncbi:MAG: hypothetical protein M3072_03170 [Candidatus Dormibacteraeota bacterium]|nr:hypothetical protein [Candidatus Dormibacteraeota bacterium]